MKISQILQKTSDVVDEGRNTASGGESTISRSRAEDDVLDKETRQLMKCFLGEFTRRMKPRWNESEALLTMKRVVDEILEKHRYAYNGRY